MSDEALLRAAARGGASAFESLYRRHRDFVLRVARRFSRDDAEALDAMQETFLALLTRPPTLTRGARLTSLLYAIARNASLAMSRRTRRLRFADPANAASVPAPAADPPEPADSPLARALARLDDGQREALLLRAVEGLTIEEIAAATGVPEGTVKSRLHAAVERLRGDEGTRRYFAD